VTGVPGGVTIVTRNFMK